MSAVRRDASAARAQRGALVAMVLVGAAVAVSLGVYAKAHTPSGRPLFTLGFSGMLQMKVWLSTAAVALLVVQLVTALWDVGATAGRCATATHWEAGPTLERQCRVRAHDPGGVSLPVGVGLRHCQRARICAQRGWMSVLRCI